MRLLALLLTLLLVPSLTARAQPDSPEALVVIGEGVASLGDDPAGAEENALWDAKRNAVERACGVFLKSTATGRNFELSSDEIRTRSEGFIRRWEKVAGSQTVETVGNSKVLRLKIRATVALLPVLKRLEQIQDAFNDLERPRLYISVKEGEESLRHLVTQSLLAEGFLIADAPESAALQVVVKVESVPLLLFGDEKAPFGLGDSVATCKARLSVQLHSLAAEESLLALSAEGVGRSYQSDKEARESAVEEAVAAFQKSQLKLLTHPLLVRWAMERQVGIIVAVEALGLPEEGRDALKQAISEQRGFREIVGETAQKESYIVRFSTRLSVRDVRRRLAEFRHPRFTLLISEGRGATVRCVASPRPRPSKTAKLSQGLRSQH